LRETLKEDNKKHETKTKKEQLYSSEKGNWEKEKTSSISDA
jgi:hypothetical protein